MKDGFVLVGLFVAFVYGLYSIIWPEKAEKAYRSNFDLDGPMKWYKPNTWQREMPPVSSSRSRPSRLKFVSVIWPGSLLGPLLIATQLPDHPAKHSV
jgi:hypothetical protein